MAISGLGSALNSQRRQKEFKFQQELPSGKPLYINTRFRLRSK
jgi:hypothetical protein